jgi:hypothetical protein
MIAKLSLAVKCNERGSRGRRVNREAAVYAEVAQRISLRYFVNSVPPAVNFAHPAPSVRAGHKVMSLFRLV